MWVARPGPRVLRHDVHCAVSRGSAGAASRGGPESPALSHENIADSQENITRYRIFSQKYPWGPGNTLIRQLRWLPGHGPPAVGWGWTSRLLYPGFPPPLIPFGAHTAHGLTGPLDPCPPNFAGAPALTGDSWVRGNYSSLPSLSPRLGAERVDGSHLYLPNLCQCEGTLHPYVAILPSRRVPGRRSHAVLLCVPAPRIASVRRNPPFPRPVLANHFASAGVSNWGDRREIDEN